MVNIWVKVALVKDNCVQMALIKDTWVKMHLIKISRYTIIVHCSEIKQNLDSNKEQPGIQRLAAGLNWCPKTGKKKFKILLG